MLIAFIMVWVVTESLRATCSHPDAVHTQEEEKEEEAYGGRRRGKR